MSVKNKNHTKGKSFETTCTKAVADLAKLSETGIPCHLM
jgi:hypothetical protein